MVNAAPVMASEIFGTALSGSDIPEQDKRLLPCLSTVEDLRSESPWIDGEVTVWASSVGGVGAQASCGGISLQKPGWTGLTKPNILGSLPNRPGTQFCSG